MTRKVNAAVDVLLAKVARLVRELRVCRERGAGEDGSK